MQSKDVCLLLQYDGTGGHSACGAQAAKTVHLKNSTAMSLLRNTTWLLTTVHRTFLGAVLCRVYFLSNRIHSCRGDYGPKQGKSIQKALNTLIRHSIWQDNVFCSTAVLLLWTLSRTPNVYSSIAENSPYNNAGFTPVRVTFNSAAISENKKFDYMFLTSRDSNLQQELFWSLKYGDWLTRCWFWSPDRICWQGGKVHESHWAFAADAALLLC